MKGGTKGGAGGGPEADPKGGTKGGTKRAIAVFCGARKGNDPAFVGLAADVGREFARRGWLLVYGGSSVGLMGEMADAALAAGGEVLGVIPQQLMRTEIGHTGLQRLEVVADMPVRKTRMIAVADGFLVLPGGFGTLDELFEVVTLRQIGMHTKPIVLCDPDNYWGKMLDACRGLVSAGLASPGDFASMEQFSTVGEAMDRLGEEEARQRKAARQEAGEQEAGQQEAGQQEAGQE
jgi:uncharacterized protein (TIGR00730 family)